MPQGLPLGGAVDLGGFDHILRHGLKTGDVYDHHIAHLLPAHKDDQAPETVFRLQQHGGAVAHQDAVEDHGPDIGQHDAADEVGQEEHGAEDVGALDVPGQDIGHGKGQQVDGDQRDKGEQRRVPEGVQERGVLKGLFVVVEPHPGPTAGDLEFAEGQEQPVAEGPQEPDAEGGEGGQQEQPDPALDGAADQAGVEGARHPLLEQGAHIDHSP